MEEVEVDCVSCEVTSPSKIVVTCYICGSLTHGKCISPPISRKSKIPKKFTCKCCLKDFSAEMINKTLNEEEKEPLTQEKNSKKTTSKVKNVDLFFKIILFLFLENS